MARDRRPRDDEDEDDDRPRRRRRPVEDEDEDEEPRPKKRRVVDEDDERPRRKARVRDEDDDDEEEEERPRRRKKKPAGMSKGLLFGLIGGGVALVGVVVLLIVLLSGGGSPKSVMQRLIRAAKVKDYGAFYDNMSSRLQQQFAGQRPPFGASVSATDPRERYIELMKAEERMGGNLFNQETDAVVLSETIIGDTAVVRIRAPNGRETEVPFVKENGRWKLGSF